MGKYDGVRAYENSRIEAQILNSEVNTVLVGRKIKKCPKCGEYMKPLQNGNFRCLSCLNEELSDERIIKEALNSSGPLTANELTKITGLPREVINAYLSDGMLTTTGAVKCKICGIPMNNGIICPACASKDKELEEVRKGDTKNRIKTIRGILPREKSEHAGMHFLGKNKNER